MEHVVQVGAALMILVAFTLAQFGRLATHSYPYLLLNVVGSIVLAVIALLERQWGFLLLEGVWTLVSLWSLGGQLRRAARARDAA
jgi:hypothetical protein